jgi:hypothetical protein
LANRSFTEPAVKQGVAQPPAESSLAWSLHCLNAGNLERLPVHAILGFFAVSFVGVGGLALALAAISDGLRGL